jgi:TolB protein
MTAGATFGADAGEGDACRGGMCVGLRGAGGRGDERADRLHELPRRRRGAGPHDGADGSGQRAISPGPDAQADFSPDGGSIAFRRGTTGAYEVWVMGAGGEAPRQLTDTPGTANSTQPAWLPDGSGLLFRRGSNRATDIWRMAPDGSGQAAVVTVADDQWYPSASPTTGRILFATTVTSRDRKIQDAAADGSGVRTLRDVAGSYDSAPAYSPDGHRIAFESDADGDMEIYVMDADGGDVRQVTRNAVHDEGPVFSPDGTRIVFTRGPDNADGDIWTMNADGSGERQLTTSPGRDESPDWQPLPDPAPTPSASPTPTAPSTPSATPTPAPRSRRHRPPRRRPPRRHRSVKHRATSRLRPRRCSHPWRRCPVRGTARPRG